METVRSKDGTELAFDRSGSGEALILVSGASTGRSVHGELAELLSTDFTVFNYDRRGRGDSGDTQPYAAQREIEDIEALIHAAGGSAAVFGNSSGAVLALRAAAKLPMTGLALWEPPFFTDPDAPRRAKAYLSRLSEELAAGRPGDAMALFLASVGVPEGAIAGMRHSPGWPSMEAIAPTLLYDALVMGDSTIPAELESVAIPTLILTGSETGAWADGSARALMTVLPNAEHRVLEGQTHAVAWDVLASALKGSSVWRPVGP